MFHLLLSILTLSLLGSCTPEEDFYTKAIPESGKNSSTATEEERPVRIEYSVEQSTEADFKSMTLEMVDAPKYGKLSECKFLSRTSWTCMYLPNKDFAGKDRIAFKTKNGDFYSEKKSFLEIDVSNVPDAPATSGDNEFTLIENTFLDFGVSPAIDVDTEAKDLSYKVKRGPKNGKLSECFKNRGALNCKYTPKKEFYGEDEFTYFATDLEGNKSELARVILNVKKEMIPVAGSSEISVAQEPSRALIVFALDISGSMDPYLDHMKKSVANFVDDLTGRGFKATIAFIDSDDKVSTVKSKIDHPDFDPKTGAKIEIKKYIPHSARVKIFEIDASEAGWNAKARQKISETKSQIDDFINALPEGKDDERLLCSVSRFLASDQAQGKDYIGVYALANEDDAVKAISPEKAMQQCLKSQKTAYTPKPSCSKKVKCDYGEKDCEGKFTYTWSETYTKTIQSINRGTCEYDKNVYTKADQTWARGYIVLEKYRFEKVKECKDAYRNADNPSGCKMVSKKIPDGTYKSKRERKGACSKHIDLVDCDNFVKEVSVFDKKVIAQKSCSRRGGNCDDHPEIMNCSHTPGRSEMKTRSRSKNSSVKSSCLVATGSEECEFSWSGTKSVSTSKDCGLTKRDTVKEYFGNLTDKSTNTLAKSIAHKLNNKERAVFVGVVNDNALNAKARLEVQNSSDLSFPSSDCKSYASHANSFEGLEGLQFKELSKLMNERGSIYSICSPYRYPSDQLDLLVEEAQLDFKVPEYSKIDDLQVVKASAHYASGKEAQLKRGSDFDYIDGRLILQRNELARDLVKIHFDYRGFKK